jgi:hypothetical protein
LQQQLIETPASSLDHDYHLESNRADSVSEMDEIVIFKHSAEQLNCPPEHVLACENDVAYNTEVSILLKYYYH